MKRADSYGKIGNCDVLLNYQRTQFSLFPEEPGARDHKEVQNMNKYELAVVVSAKIEDDARAAVIEKVKEMITRFGGNVTDVDEWGKRRFAYEIQKMKKDFTTSYTSSLTRVFQVRSNSVSASWTTYSDIYA